MMREQRAADVLVQAVLEMILEVTQAPVQDLRLIAAMYTQYCHNCTGNHANSDTLAMET